MLKLILQRDVSTVSSSFLVRAFDRKLSIPAAATRRKLEGKVALITGAATGIGKETATRFIEEGARVVIADIQEQAGRAAAEELGENAAFVACDVSDESHVAAAVDLAVALHGRLDVLYNNAGIPCRTPPSVVDLDMADFDRVMSVNARSVVAGVKHGARIMIPRRSGCILCTGSVTGVMGGLAQHTYSVSKSTVIGIMRSAAAELGKHGIRINCISPFALPTAFSLPEMREYFPGADDGVLAGMLHGSGALEGARCEPGDVASAAVFLASDDAKYISGQNLVVDGGFTSIKSLNLRMPPDQI